MNFDRIPVIGIQSSVGAGRAEKGYNQIRQSFLGRWLKAKAGWNAVPFGNGCAQHCACGTAMLRVLCRLAITVRVVVHE